MSKTTYRWFWNGVKYKVPMCCILFFDGGGWQKVKKEIPEYSDTMLELTDTPGLIFCPECITRRLILRGVPITN